jgi:superfamily II DNA or RNA helicase
LDTKEFKTYQEELKFLVSDKTRIDWMVQKIKDISTTGNTLVLIDRIATGDLIMAQIPEATFISGGTKVKDRSDHYKAIHTAVNQITVATYGVAAVGINIPRIFNLVLIEPGKSFVRVIQSIGRGIRKAEDKSEVMIWDIASSCKFSKRHLATRKKYYNEAKYPHTITKVDI